MTQLPLMVLPPAALAAAERARRFKWKGHAAQPGTGPAGETCKTCEHAVGKRMASTYYKCELRRSTWTGGAGTDIKLKDPACSKWEKTR
jgi:hypothetical protein